MTSVFRRGNELQQIKEEIYNVNVEIECSKDVFFWFNSILVLTTKHQLSVEKYVAREDKRTETSIEYRHDFVVEENGGYRDDHQDHENDL